MIWLSFAQLAPNPEALVTGLVMDLAPAIPTPTDWPIAETYWLPETLRAPLTMSLTLGMMRIKPIPRSGARELTVAGRKGNDKPVRSSESTGVICSCSEPPTMTIPRTIIKTVAGKIMALAKRRRSQEKKEFPPGRISMSSQRGAMMTRKMISRYANKS